MNNSQKPEQLKWSELKGRAVVDINTAKRVGSVEDLVLDPQQYQIVGLRFKSGLFSATQLVPIEAIKAIGGDAVTLQLEQLAKDNPQPALVSPPAPAHQDLPTLNRLMGNGVVTEGGTHVGEIVNAQLSTQPLAITGYELNKGGLFSKTHTFELTPAVHYGEKLVIIPDSLLDTFTPAAILEEAIKVHNAADHSQN